MGLEYDLGRNENAGWILAETSYDPAFSAKIESIFALGNGYMGVRSATEERYAFENRGLYVAGVFDAFPGEVTELANLPDWLTLEIDICGERFSCSGGRINAYRRALDMRSGSTLREIDWESPGGRRVELRFERFVSMDDLHCAALRLSIQPLNFSGEVRVISGIDGRVTNAGVQHLLEGQLRLLPGGAAAMLTQTQESGVEICIAVSHRYALDGRALDAAGRPRTDRRCIELESTWTVEEKAILSVEKYVFVYTGRDRDGGGAGPRLLELCARRLEERERAGYDELYTAHAARWDALWSDIDVAIAGPGFDQLAVRFALFHLIQMTPRHDPRLSIAAKGLTGEGYKGHVFWDTEVFILPVFTLTMPDVAAQLLGYRHRTLDGARAKAKDNGYGGAMYPWESTDSGVETTPDFWGVDIETGRPIPILSGRLEQHISVDIPFAVWQYYRATGDVRFMCDRGLEVMIETARFWASRLEWNVGRECYEITGVMGPDEYGERVANNAYTNNMVRWHLANTVELYDELSSLSGNAVRELTQRVSFGETEKRDWIEKAANIVTNIDPDTGFVLQYDGFTEKRPLDLSEYRGRVGAIIGDFGWRQLTRMQVVKQADTVMLLYLRGDDFTRDAKRLNWEYYEPKTLHDSSLSAPIHSIVASDMQDAVAAYDYFIRAASTDLGPTPDGSDSGVHAASLGGVWQAAVNGFGGVRVTNTGRLRISPRLPVQWTKMTFHLVWHGRRMEVAVKHDSLEITARGEGFSVESFGKSYRHPGTGTLQIALE